MAGDCLFCAIVAGAEASHVVLDEPDVIAFLDHRPVFKGHVLVIPRVHVVTLPDLPDELLAPLFGAVSRCCTAVVEGTRRAGLVGRGEQHREPSRAAPPRARGARGTKGDGLRGFFWPRVEVRRRSRDGRLRHADPSGPVARQLERTSRGKWSSDQWPSSRDPMRVMNVIHVMKMFTPEVYPFAWHRNRTWVPCRREPEITPVQTFREVDGPAGRPRRTQSSSA